MNIGLRLSRFLFLIFLISSIAFSSNFKHFFASFATSFDDTRYEERTNNIRRAVEILNGKTIKKNDTFSFNEALGKRSEEKGFREAKIFRDDGSVGTGFGGGICQVSTTLYNTALLAGLEILERHQHSRPVSYVPFGRDATVSFGKYDLIFKNTLSSDIKILAETKSDKLVIKMFGNRKPNNKMRIISKCLYTKRDVTSKGLISSKGRCVDVTTLRIATKNGIEIFREIISKDKYVLGFISP